MSASAHWQELKRHSARIWALSTPYFRSEDRWKARALLLAIVLLNLGAVYMLVQINEWNRVFYDALQNRNAGVFWVQLGRFTYLAFAYIVIAVYRFYLTQLLELRWREWLTAHYLQRWLAHDAFYKMELARYSQPDGSTGAGAAVAPDNPDQRIQEDLFLFTRDTVGLSMGLLNAVVTLLSFVGILWSLSGSFSFDAFGTHFTIPGFMVWLALLYCMAGSWATYWIGRPQIALNYRQQRFEADFRHHMTRVREYSEAIALDRGATVERTQLDARFTTLLANYLHLIKAQKNLIWFTNFFGQAAVVFPFIVAAPRFFSGAIQLGELMQIASAFGRVQDSLSWFVESYADLAAWRATSDRLTSFEAGLAAQARSSSTARTQSDGDGLEAHDLTIALPTGAVLLSHLDLAAAPGDRILITGPSGSGKSTLLRALAGIWPFARGTVALPAGFDTHAMFVSQRPYFPNGPLRDALAYPEPAGRYSDAQLAAALDAALLPQLASRLDDEDAWGQQLSGGEQQRLALARVLLKRPAWVFADEVTSALDAAAEQSLYQRLLELARQSGGVLVSIAHRPGVAAFHEQRWELKPRPRDAMNAADIDAAHFELRVSGNAAAAAGLAEAAPPGPQPI